MVPAPYSRLAACPSSCVGPPSLPRFALCLQLVTLPRPCPSSLLMAHYSPIIDRRIVIDMSGLPRLGFDVVVDKILDIHRDVGHIHDSVKGAVRSISRQLKSSFKEAGGKRAIAAINDVRYPSLPRCRCFGLHYPPRYLPCLFIPVIWGVSLVRPLRVPC